MRDHLYPQGGDMLPSVMFVFIQEYQRTDTVM